MVLLEVRKVDTFPATPQHENQNSLWEEKKSATKSTCYRPNIETQKVTFHLAFTIKCLGLEKVTSPTYQPVFFKCQLCARTYLILRSLFNSVFNVFIQGLGYNSLEVSLIIPSD